MSSNDSVAFPPGTQAGSPGSLRSAKVRALVQDALFQVLDNSVFRILAIVVLIPILAFFVVSIRPEGVSLLFGVRSWSWQDIGLDMADPHLKVIDTVLAILLDGIGGVFGVLFCITATAFFVPRMIEKGAADLLFHKPVSRVAFYFSRYLSGLFFVGILSTILVGGVFAGLAIVSGHVDTGILWSTVTLVYVFTLVYSLCMLIGVVTRSTVAAILLTVLFWFLNSCVHTAWAAMEVSQEMSGRLAESVEKEMEDKEVSEEESEELVEAIDDRPAFLRYIHKGLHVGHLVLPKTSDADVLGQKLRKAVSPAAYQEVGIAFRIEALPSDWDELDSGEVVSGHPALPDALGEVVFATKNSQDQYVIVRRRPLEMTTKTMRSGRTTIRKEKLGAAHASLLTALGDIESTDDWASYGGASGDANSVLPSLDALHFRVAFRHGNKEIEVGILRRDDWLYSFELQQTEGADPEVLYDFVDALDVEPVRQDWYSERFVKGAELAYNPIYSVLSSLAFALVMLALGAWRLTRIDF